MIRLFPPVPERLSGCEGAGRFVLCVALATAGSIRVRGGADFEARQGAAPPLAQQNWRTLPQLAQSVVRVMYHQMRPRSTWGEGRRGRLRQTRLSPFRQGVARVRLCAAARVLIGRGTTFAPPTDKRSPRLHSIIGWWSFAVVTRSRRARSPVERMNVGALDLNQSRARTDGADSEVKPLKPPSGQRRPQAACRRRAVSCRRCGLPAAAASASQAPEGGARSPGGGARWPRAGPP